VLVDPYCYKKCHRPLITRVASLSKKNYRNNQTKVSFLILKLSPCSEYCMLSSGWFPSIWILYANVLEHIVCSIFHRQVGMKKTYPPMKMEQTECSETFMYKIQMPGNHPEESIQQKYHFFRNNCTVDKIFWLWGMPCQTQKNTYLQDH
jgi:hypothetical protein